MNNIEHIEVIGNPENSIPKYATNANFKKLENGDIVIAFASKSLDSKQGVLIETIIIDEQHAREIVKIMSDILEKNDK